MGSAFDSPLKDMGVRRTQLTVYAFFFQMSQPRLAPDERVKANVKCHDNKNAQKQISID